MEIITLLVLAVILFKVTANGGDWFDGMQSYAAYEAWKINLECNLFLGVGIVAFALFGCYFVYLMLHEPDPVPYQASTPVPSHITAHHIKPHSRSSHTHAIVDASHGATHTHTK